MQPGRIIDVDPKPYENMRNWVNLKFGAMTTNDQRIEAFFHYLCNANEELGKSCATQFKAYDEVITNLKQEISEQKLQIEKLTDELKKDDTTGEIKKS
jgi:heat shock protein HspQ